MNKLLAKLFIKDYNNVKDCRVRNAYGTMTSIFGIICNTILASAKIIIGAMSASVSILADGINNLTDMSSSTVSLIGFRMSNRPPDKKHPFGHARMEYLASLIISFIIIFVGFQLATNSIQSIISGEKPIITIISLIILSVSIVIKGYMAYFYHANAKLIDSQALRAVRMDSINDVIATTFILISAIVGYFTNLNLDGYMGAAMSLYIIVAGIKLMKDTLNPLLGEKPDSELVKSIVNKIKSYPNILGIHDLVIHNYGANKFFVTLHAEVDCKIDVMSSHELIDTVEKDITTADMHCVIHMDPIITDDPRIDNMHDITRNIINSINDKLALHDFRVIIGPNRTNIIFDLVIPNDCELDKNDLDCRINALLKEYDPTFNAIINFDHYYV